MVSWPDFEHSQSVRRLYNEIAFSALGGTRTRKGSGSRPPIPMECQSIAFTDFATSALKGGPGGNLTLDRELWRRRSQPWQAH